MMGFPRRHVIAISAFLIQMVCFGVGGSIGVYNTTFMAEFGSSAAATSLIGAINIGLLLGAGPIASYLMQRLTYRKVALLGSVLSTLGLLLSIFAPSIFYLDVFLGFFTGFGFCLLYIPSHTLSGLFYEEHRSLATGIVTSGSGLGGVVFPIITHTLIEEYHWRGSLLILSAINLHNFAFSLFLDEPPQATVKKTKEIDITVHGNSEDLLMLVEHSGNVGKETVCSEKQQNDKDISLAPNLDQSKAREKQENQHLLKKNGHVTHKEESDLTSDVTAPSNFTTKSDAVCDEKKCSTGNDSKKIAAKKSHCHVMCDFGFLVYFASNVFWNLGAAILYILLPEYLFELTQSTANGALGLTLFSCAVTVGGGLGGAIGNLKFVNRLFFYIFCTSGFGLFIMMVAVPVFHTVVAMVIILLCAGLMFGMLLGLLVVVTADLLGSHLLGDGMGFLMLANGLGGTIGPPIGGLLRDELQSYTASFYLAGSLTIFGAILIFLIPFKRKILNTKKDATSV